MRAVSLSVIVGLLAVSGSAMAQDIVWDYGPQTGPNGGCWANNNTWQNFAERVVLDEATRINGYQHFTCIDGISGMQFEIKFLADDNGVPGAEVARFELTNFDALMEGAEFRYDFRFDDVLLEAGTWWVGLDGVGFEAGQSSINPGPGDSLMAQFNAESYGFMTGVGDQMFRLLGNSPRGCYADCDGDNELSLFDFLCYTNAFNAGDDFADCDGDGELSLFDFLCFVNEFNAGC
jgi:hypothetical protein